jgi:hypothetical protein
MSKDVKLDVLGVKFPEFAKTLIPLLLECWVESAPSKDKNKFSGTKKSYMYHHYSDRQV